MHHKHVFLSNESSQDEAICWVRDILTNGTLAYNACDYGTVIGVINLETGEYTHEEKDYKPVINTIEKLEFFVNTLFGQSKLDVLLDNLKYNLRNEFYWQASEVCKEIDGILYPTKNGVKWTAKEPFPVCDGYINMCGVTDWCDCTSVNSPNKAKYAVIVDFHS